MIASLGMRKPTDGQKLLVRVHLISEGKMRYATLMVWPLLLAVVTAQGVAQTPAPSVPSGPTFDVVSIKPSPAGARGGMPYDRPDGGFTRTNIPVTALIAQAYPPAIPIEMIGVPEWARTERFNFSATSTLAHPTADDRRAMLRAMLADRFKLVVHVEDREQQVYDLVLARSDGRLGSGLTPLDVDCDAQMAANRAAAEAARAAGTPPPPPPRPDLTKPPPPCTLRTINALLRDRSGDGQGGLGDVMEGEASMNTLASALRIAAGRAVVNKTGLAGSYRVKMNLDLMAAVRGPSANAPTRDPGPSVFTAVQEQLGLKLQSSRAQQQMLVIDRLERPTPN